MAKPSDSLSIEKTQINSLENDTATNAIFSTFSSSSTSASLPTSTSTSTLLAGNVTISNSSSSISQLNSNVINSILIDSGGVLWVGSSYERLNKADLNNPLLGQYRLNQPIYKS